MESKIVHENNYSIFDWIFHTCSTCHSQVGPTSKWERGEMNSWIVNKQSQVCQIVKCEGWRVSVTVGEMINKPNLWNRRPRHSLYILTPTSSFGSHTSHSFSLVHWSHFSSSSSSSCCKSKLPQIQVPHFVIVIIVDNKMLDHSYLGHKETNFFLHEWSV